MPCHFLVFSLRTPFCRDAVIQAPPFCRENLVSLYNLRGHDPTRVISRGICKSILTILKALPFLLEISWSGTRILLKPTFSTFTVELVPLTIFWSIALALCTCKKLRFLAHATVLSFSRQDFATSARVQVQLWTKIVTQLFLAWFQHTFVWFYLAAYGFARYIWYDFMWAIWFRLHVGFVPVLQWLRFTVVWCVECGSRNVADAPSSSSRLPKNEPKVSGALEACSICKKCHTGWWFQRFFIFDPTWGNDPNWLILQMGWNMLKPPTSILDDAFETCLDMSNLSNVMQSMPFQNLVPANTFWSSTSPQRTLEKLWNIAATWCGCFQK